MKCDKAGCRTEATIEVRYQDPDGLLEFHACYFHAKAFERWVYAEAAYDGSDAGSVWLLEGEK